MRIVCPIIAICLAVAGELPAATYYVSPHGSDSNHGSFHSPFLTLSRAAQAAHAGDTVLVSNGTYGHENAVTGGDSADTNASPVVLTRSGLPGAPITFKAESRGGAILDCQLICDSYFDLGNTSYIVIEDFVITRGYREAIHSNGSASFITLRGNQIDYIANRQSSVNYGLDGMYTSAACHDFVIDSNSFHDIGRTNPTNLDHGLYLQGWNFTVTNNIFYNLTRGWGIQMANGLTNILVANNTFAFIAPADGGQIMMWNNEAQVTIRNNIFYQAQTAAIAVYQSSATACAVDHNLVSGSVPVIESANGCAIGTNLLGANPMFVNAAAYNFELPASSPAAKAGVQIPGLTTDYNGALRPSSGGIAIGALEPATTPVRQTPALRTTRLPRK